MSKSPSRPADASFQPFFLTPRSTAGARSRRSAFSDLVLERRSDAETSWPALVRLYEELTGDRLRPPTSFDIEQRVKPRLLAALARGEVGIGEATFRRVRERDEGVHITKPDHLPGPAPAGPRKLTRIAPEKTFVEVRVVDAEGKPLSGRKFRLELPDGRKKEGVLGADGQVRETNIDPGTARLTLLADPGEIITGAGAPDAAEDAPDDEKDAADASEDEGPSFVELALVDDDGQPVAGQAFEVILPNGETRAGTLDENGTARVEGVPAGSCEVTFPDVNASEGRSS